MKIKEVIRKKQNRLKKSLLGVLAVSAATVSLFPQTVMASGVSDVTQPLMNLKTLVISIIGAVGVIILAKNVMEFAQAYQQQDSSSMNSAIKGIVAGLIMAAISSVLTSMLYTTHFSTALPLSYCLHSLTTTPIFYNPEVSSLLLSRNFLNDSFLFCGKVHERQHNL